MTMQADKHKYGGLGFCIQMQGISLTFPVDTAIVFYVEGLGRGFLHTVYGRISIPSYLIAL